MSWICGACHWQNFTPGPPCVNCGKGVVPDWFPRDIYAPASEAEREAVRVAQRALRLVPTGDMDEATRASLRGTQRLFNLPVTGILDTATALVIDGLRPYQIEPEEKPWRPY